MLSPILIGLAVTGALGAPDWEIVGVVNSTWTMEMLHTDNTAWIKTLFGDKARCMRREQIVPPYIKVFEESCLKDGAEEDSYFLPAFQFPEIVKQTEDPMNEAQPRKSLKYGRGDDTPFQCVVKAEAGSHGCQKCVRDSATQTVTVEACPILDDYFYPDEVAKRYATWWLSRQTLS